jgi:predicted nucleic acid-binding protein
VIFVDTSFWVAIRNDRDGHHATASRLLTVADEHPLVTSNHVRGETWTFLRRKVGHAAAMGFLDHLGLSPRLQVVPVTSELEERAWVWLRRHDEREYSFVDATSFALMRSLKIKDALAFDGDFTAAGFRELRP